MRTFVVGTPKPVQPSEQPDGTMLAAMSKENYIAVKSGDFLVMLDGSRYPISLADEDGNWSIVTQITASV